MRLIDWARTPSLPSSRSFAPRPSRRFRDFNRILLRLERLEDRSTPAILAVNSLLDNQIPGDGLVTLREAINAHNNLTTTDLGQTATGNDTIELRSLGGTISLTQGELFIGANISSGTRNTTLDILGPGASQLIISGSNLSRVFNNDTTSTLILRDLTIADGRASGGGGVFNIGTLFIEQCVVTNNTLVGNGLGFGGGIFNQVGGTLTVSRSLISNNTGGGGAGVIRGAGIASAGNLNVQNSTFTGNSSDDSGGAIIVGAGVVVLTNNTIVGNRANSDNIGTAGGGGIFLAGGVAATLVNNIIAGNFATTNDVPDDISGVVGANSAGNLIGVDTGFSGITDGTNGNQIGTATLPIGPLLAPLGNYGGPTRTFALLPGSRALDTGSSAGGLSFDQRGIARGGNFVDIGAFESSGFQLTPVNGSTPQSTLVETRFPNPLTVRVVANNPLEPVAGGFIRVMVAPAPNGAGPALTGPSPIGTTGVAALNAFATSVPGTYSVSIAVDLSSPPAVFTLTNVGIVTKVSPAPGSANPTFFGDPVSLTALAQGDDGTPITAGLIDLFFDGTYIGTIDVRNPAPVAIPPDLLTVGDHVVTSVYTSDSEETISGSESSLVLTVLRAPTRTTVTVDRTSTVFGDPVGIAGTVTTLHSATVPTGTVTLIVNGVEVATTPLISDPNGPRFEFLTSALPPGVNTLAVRYNGDPLSDASVSITATVAVNARPSTAPVGDQFALEGVEKAFDLGGFADPGSPGPFTVVVDWGDGTAPTTFTVASPGPLGSQPHTYDDNGLYTVTVTVSDGTLLSDPRTFMVAVANVAPRLLDPLPDRFTLTDSTDFTLGTLRIFEPGVFDSLRVVVDWGDGSPPTIVDLGPGEREIPAAALTHRFPSASRTYQMTIIVGDKDGEFTFEVKVASVVVAPLVPPVVLLDFRLGEEIMDADDRFEEDDSFRDDLTELAEDFEEAVEDFAEENLADEVLAIAFRGVELIRLELPRFGPPIGVERPEPRGEMAAPPAPVPVATRVGETPPPSSPLNEKSPLGTPLNRFNSVFDSDDSVNLIDSLRRELSRPKPSMATPSQGNTNDAGTGGPMSYRNPMSDGEPPANRPNWMTPLAMGAFGAMWWQGTRRHRKRKG